ncbi:MAG: hypothetical protein E7514_03480 [Ruminococcaceae bacterium]|nr:hypothetical protein [Oscillospiraceae bacterium]
MNKKEVFKILIISTLTVLFAAALIKSPEPFAKGIRDAMQVCIETLVPSLVMFMALSHFAAYSGLCDLFGALTGKAVKKLFNLPEISAGIILMSFIGGYPVGAKMTSLLLGEGKITKQSAKRLNLFTVNAGPAFIIGAVGNGFYGSAKIGIILYLSSLAASVTIGLLSGLVFKEKSSEAESGKYIVSSPAAAFTKAVTGAAYSVLKICVWVLFFGGVTGFISSLSESDAARLLCSFSEVTNGVKMCSQTYSLPFVSALISFGGISVMFQILSDTEKSGAGFLTLLISRSAAGVFSYIFSLLLLKAFHIDSEVFAGFSQTVGVPYSVSLSGSVCTVIMCVLAIFEVDTRKKV